MAHQPDRRSGSGERTTLGRLGGLTRSEAERGERALWLTGGGYRAALFHLGALTRLNELGLLARLGTVGAVSGGSIMAALLATRVEWPLHGAYRDWPERVAEPLREIVRRNAKARALLRRPLGGGADAALEEHYARQLVAALGGEPRWGPRFVFGASGLTLSGLAAGWEECLEWEIGAAAHPPGYHPDVIAETIATVRTDLNAFGEAEQAVLENHAYLLADAALRERGMARFGGVETRPPEPPHPHWMSEARVREALRGGGRRIRLARLRPRRPRSARRAEASSAAVAELLERHRPVLHYDSLESCRADSAATICGFAAPGRCNALHRADGSVIAAVAPRPGEARLDLDFLRWPTYPSGVAAREDDYLDECGGSHAADSLAARRQPGCADVVYGRARHDREGRLWLQYWLFFYYDDKGWLGLRRHEGDWEMVQLRLGDDGAPEAATFARHAGAERLDWGELEVLAGEDGVAPVVYPARGSHAPLPRPGSYEAPVLLDHSDGGGPRLRPRLEPIGDDGPGWLRWRGRWGSTRRREYFEGDSPRGPRQQPQWWDPLLLHEEARPAGAALLPGGGGAHGPPEVAVEARREGGIAVVSYDFAEPAAGEAEPARILAAPFDGGAEPCPSRAFPLQRRRGSFALQLPGDREWRGVRIAATAAGGGCGGTVTARFA